MGKKSTIELDYTALDIALQASMALSQTLDLRVAVIDRPAETPMDEDKWTVRAEVPRLEIAALAMDVACYAKGAGIPVSVRFGGSAMSPRFAAILRYGDEGTANAASEIILRLLPQLSLTRRVDCDLDGIPASWIVQINTPIAGLATGVVSILCSRGISPEMFSVYQTLA